MVLYIIENTRTIHLNNIDLKDKNSEDLELIFSLYISIGCHGNPQKIHPQNLCLKEIFYKFYNLKINCLTLPGARTHPHMHIHTY